MKACPILRLCLGLSAVLLVAGCASKPAPKESESGYLADYSQLRQADCLGAGKAGGTCYAWTSPRFTPENYNAIILERLDFFPDPKPTPEVSQETLDKIRSYIDSKVRESIGEHIRIVNTPGPGVVRMRWAVTAVGSESEGLAFYQFVPAALVITAAKAAVEGGLPRTTRIAFEIELTDSVTREPLGLSIRGGSGERLKSYREGERKVDPNALKKLFDTWAEGGAAGLTKYIKAK
jgi:Protein of unknown function (DUF3313)